MRRDAATGLALAVCALLLGGCSQDPGSSAASPATATPTTPTAPGTTQAAGRDRCPGGTSFNASNAGVAGHDLTSLADRLGTTPLAMSDLGRLMPRRLPGGGSVLYDVAPVAGGWRLTRVHICPGPAHRTSCGRAVRYAGRDYRLSVMPPGVGSGVGRVLGPGSVLGCSPRPVGPIGIYEAPEEPVRHTVLTSGGAVRQYVAG